MINDDHKPILIGRDHGHCWEALGSTWHVKLTGHDTNGAFALLEQTVHPGTTIARHVHAEEDETLYILEGEADLTHDLQTSRLCAGATVHLPRGAAHGLKSVGDLPCRILHILTPAGLENYFREVEKHTAERGCGWAEVVALSAEYGIRFLPQNRAGG